MRDRARFGIGVGDRQRNALAVVVHAQDHELAGLALPGDAWRLDREPLDIGREELGLDDREHQGNPREPRWGGRTSRRTGDRPRPLVGPVAVLRPHEPVDLGRVDYQKPAGSSQSEV